LSFGFARKSVLTKKLQDSGLRDKSTLNDEQEKDFVKEVNLKRGLESTKPKPETKKALVIPCHGNKYKFDLEAKKAKIDQGQTKAATEEDEAAAKELEADSKRWAEGEESKAESRGRNEGLTIAMNQEEREKAVLDSDLEDRADVSTLDDYENVPVQGFGLAVLRGMGFKAEEGIGGFKKAAVQCIEPDIRPKGLGLGAQRPNKGGGGGGGESKAAKKDGEEDLSMKKGAFVLVERGANKGCYGKVEGLDEETARVVVKLSVGNADSVSISENIVKVVSKEEYKKYSRVINKDEYEKYAKKQRDREIEWNGDSKQKTSSERERTSRGNNERDSKHKTDREDTREYRDSKHRTDREYRDSKHKTDREHRDSHGSKDLSSSSNGGGSSSWLRPHLRVRLIDEDYKKGKYFNSKAIVEDVVSPYSCVVRTDTGRLLDEVDPRYCETVVPKGEKAAVMIVHGRRKGRIAEILCRDKANCTAAVQLLPDKDEVLKLSYDDICEYTGDLDHL